MRGHRPDVIIVGGGLIGCALAAELAARGRAVTVIERAEPGAEASGAAAGMLAPQSEARTRDAFFDLTIESRDLYPAWVRGLVEETGVDVGYRKTGLLHCRLEGEAAVARAEPFAWQRAAGLSVIERQREDLAAQAGGRLSPRIRDAVFFPDEAVVDPRRLTRAAWLAAVRRGAIVQTGTSVLGFRIEDGVCRGVETEAGPIDAATTVDAAGAWAAFGGRLPVPLPVEPVRGQIVALCLSEPLETIVASDEVYLVPRPDGTVLLGSTAERVGFRKAVTAEAVAHLIGAAARLVPGLGSARFVSAWSGLRPGTPDGLPVLGASPVRGLFFAAGHFRNGILLAPVTARLLADLLTSGPSRDLSPFSIERFAPALQTA
ncbi:MAG TPA: glycine oxidase ThiO [Thermoanaerobaculia bacterium]|jgi:glycine oxidase|nr:glycine oxidase ThiO [Thermoanaerobaculia bacterium]